jgi:lysophospholipase L1-like esterase
VDDSGSSRRARWLARLALALAGALLAVALVEVGARVVSGNWTGSFLEARLGLLPSSYPVSYDPELGWVPRAGYSGTSKAWRATVTITPDGLRANGPRDASARGRPILALGDSFTFGNGVGDAATWPAHLERRLQRPVLNAGVFGYGVDQIVLRARKLVDGVSPAWVIVSFIPDDLNRCELSEFGAAKPYFFFADGALRAGNQPVPPPQPVARDATRRVLGHSYVAHALMSRVAPHYWFANGHRAVRVHGDGKKVSIHLLKALVDELSARGIRVLVVAQAERDLRPDQAAVAAAVLRGLAGTPALVLDLHVPLGELRARDAARVSPLYRVHMTDAGNAFVADRIAEVIRGAEASDRRDQLAR